MPKNKRGREEAADTYESDGGFVSNDDGNAPKSKKSKNNKSSAASKGGSSHEKFWTLSSGRTPRRVNIGEFKNNTLINIREFYEKDDEYLPGKKGISLTIDQYKALLKSIPEINAALKRADIDVGACELPLPDDEEDSKMQRNAKVKAKVKKEKSNIEETSEEEDE